MGWIDITLAVLFFSCLVLGMTRGFVRSLAQLLGSVGALLAGYFFCDDLSLWVKANTEIYDTIYSIVAPRLEAGTADAVSAFLEQLPESLSALLADPAQDLTLSLAETASSMLLNILSFLAIVLAVRILLFFFVLLFSKKYRGGLTGFLDGLFGCAFGLLEGLFLVFLFLALLVPVSELLEIPGIPQALEQSLWAHYLYDNNLLFLIAEKFMI